MNEDGLVDIALGAGLFFGSLFFGLDQSMRVRVAGFAVLAPLAIALVMGALRRGLVYPRIGRRPLGVGAVPGMAIILTALFFIGLLAALVVQRPGHGTTPSGLVWLLRGLLLAAAVVLLALGLRTGLRRFHLYAAVMALSVLGAGLVFGSTRVGMVVTGVVPGAMLFAAGIVTFARFLRKYPNPRNRG